MDKILLKLGLQYLAGKLDGKKTYLGAAVLILLGIGKIITALVGIIGTMYQDIGAPPMDIDTAMATMQSGAAMIAGGFAALGIGHKIEKAG